jgi:predicted kinase
MKNRKKGIIWLILSKLSIIKQPEAIFLIGLPGCGKTTYIKEKRKINKHFSKYSICSTDGYIETMAAINGKKYNDVFEELYPDAEKNFFEKINYCIENNISMFIDRTNCSAEDRKQILNKIPSHYKKRAIIFHIPHDELKKRLHNRHETTGKLIPEDALQKIIDKYEHPTSLEFDIIESA